MCKANREEQIDTKNLHARTVWDKNTEARQRSAYYENELQNVLALDEKGQKTWIKDSTKSLRNRRYVYEKRSALVQQVANSVGLHENAPVMAGNGEYMPNQQQELTKDQKKALALEKEVRLKEAKLKEERRLRLWGIHVRLEGDELKREKSLLKKKLEAIDMGMKAALEEAGLSEAEKLEIKIRAMNDRIDAQSEYAYLIPYSSPHHRKALDRKEEMVLELRDLKKEHQILKLREEGRDDEAAREKRTARKHFFYELFRLFKFPKPDASLSKEGVTCFNPRNGKLMVNKGRAAYGGTKPMYFFEEDEEEEGREGKVWLYKEAVTCIGIKAPHRAYVTEGASKLQKYLCGENHYVPVFVAKNENNEAIGTFQEKVKSLEHSTQDNPKVDLYRWQEQPGNHIEERVTDQILREHTLDWVLGNFDTKGENFLQKEDGSLVSIDKEASFTHLGDPDAEHMSRTARLHNNDTIYNVLFTQFVTRPAESDDPLFLNFDSVEEYVRKMENLDDQEYLGFFDKFLTQKFGPKNPLRAVRNTLREEKEQLILRRKHGLREEYRNFFGQLIGERLRFINGREPAHSQFTERYGNSYVVQNNGKYRYLFPSER